MSALTKKHLTEKSEQVVEMIIMGSHTQKFLIPNEKAQALMLLLNEFRMVESSKRKKKSNDSISADAVFNQLDKKFGRAGAALQGARLKEGLTQIELANKINIQQSDLSKMEHGKRSIGIKMAQRLAQILMVDYRIFL